MKLLERLEIRDRPDFLSGLLFIALGMFGVVEASQYDLGTARRMGAGYFPLILSGILIALGIATAVMSLKWRGAGEAGAGAGSDGNGERTDERSAAEVRSDVIRGLRTLIFVVGALVLFAVSVPQIGLVLAVMLLVFVSSFAEPSLSWVATAVIAVLMAFIAVAVFRWGIGLPLPLWPR